MVGFSPLGSAPLAATGANGPVAVDLDVGDYVIAGQSLTISVGRTVSLAAGAYVIAGHSLSIVVTRAVNLAAGAYVIAGHPINITVRLNPSQIYGREPVVIAEVTQPRCALRFGVGACTATGTPKCYNTYWTCLDKPNYDPTGSIAWRLSRPGDDVDWLYEEDAGGNNIKTNAIPILQTASHTSSRINPGASRTGESPLGRRATAQIKVTDAVWDDHVGDFYLADRTPRATPVGFGTLLNARNPFYPGWTAKIYEGYKGQALSQMQSRVFDVEQVVGPDAGDSFTIQCRDPLDLLRSRNAKYPPTSQIDLRGDIDASTTTIPVRCLAAQLTSVFGNTGTTRYVVIGDEIISYTGHTGTEPDLTLTGVVRGVLLSQAASHSDEDAVQRGAYHVDQRPYAIASYIIKDHTIVPDSFIDDTQWNAEGNRHLSTILATAFIPEPVAVEQLLGELGRDGLFSIWWDDRLQTIPLLAVRPPSGIPVKWNDDNNISSLTQTTKIDDRMTRVSVFFGIRDWMEPLNEVTNYKNRLIRIETEVESEVAAGGKIVDNTINSRWVRTFGNATLLSFSLLRRFALPPRYITLMMDAKDRTINIGDAIDLTTRYIRDTEGNAIETRWQVIGIDDPKPGSQIKVELQSFAFQGKFAIIMANDAPDYVDATEAERLDGCWIAENTGLMPDGTEAYLLQ